MFTGIIEEIGAIKEFVKDGKSAFITVECKNILQDIKIGDSIAIDGVCQTVCAFDKSSFSAQVSAETLSVTSFPSYKAGTKVNLERALSLNGRLGGHIVTGHIDGLAKVKRIQETGEFYTLRFEAQKEQPKYIVKKGSITVNGISLTVADITSNEFEIAVIPHTFKNTNLNILKTGEFVNIEVDILAKYIEKFLLRGNNSTIDENFLKENGFF